MDYVAIVTMSPLPVQTFVFGSPEQHGTVQMFNVESTPMIRKERWMLSNGKNALILIRSGGIRRICANKELRSMGYRHPQGSE